MDRTSGPVANIQHLETRENLGKKIQLKSKSTNAMDTEINKQEINPQEKKKQINSEDKKKCKSTKGKANSEAKIEENKTLIRQYVTQLTKGCGRRACKNKDCLSNPGMVKINRKKAVIKAVKLAQKKGKSSLCLPMEMPPAGQVKGMFDTAKTSGDWTEISWLVEKVFSNANLISQSFFEKDSHGNHADLSKDSALVDFKEMDEVYQLISSTEELSRILNNAISTLIKKTHFVESSTSSDTSPSHKTLIKLRAFIILLDNYHHWKNINHQKCFIEFLSVTVGKFPKNCLDVLEKWLAVLWDQERLQAMLSLTQQFITLRWFGRSSENKVNPESSVIHGTKLLGIIHGANTEQKKIYEGKTTIGYKEFYNETVNEQLNIEAEYDRWKSNKFSFANHPYILHPASKAEILQFDARGQMQEQLETAIFDALVNDSRAINASIVHLNLKVHRDNLIEDTIRQLQITKTRDLKKHLKVEFIGEQGVDAGGVTKEFFQLIIAQIFDEKYGMFTYSDETRTFWFSRTSFENEMYELIGMILGLAIYNAVILDIRFPDVVYKKLMGLTPDLNDYESAFPDMGKGLRQLLAFDGDVANTYCRNFEVSYEYWGETKVVELKKGGGDIPVTEKNRNEYVKLYVEYMLMKSIKDQFQYFKYGFDAVCSGESLSLFRWQEIELLICGCPELNFNDLEDGCRLQDGYDEKSQVIKNFWEIVHEFSFEDKKKLLFFCTGSDRAPIKGLGSLNFTISKNGGDSNRLPTAHTCFNHLLLPEYSTKEKLKRLLSAAIQNSKGFGLL